MYKIPIMKLQLVHEGEQAFNVKHITSPEHARDVLLKYLEGADREHFVVLVLNTKNEIMGINTVSIGSLNAAIIHPREVFKPAILANANAVILGHNHPSGDPTPSSEDTAITRRLVEAGKILGIEILDHVIVGPTGRYVSLKERCII